MARKKALPLITDFDNIPEEALVPPEEQPYSIPEHWKWVRFKYLSVFQSKSIDPSKQPTEKFVLYSVPSFNLNQPEELFGSEIGSTKQSVSFNDVLVCKINPRINRVWVVDSASSNTIASSEWIVMRPSFGISEFYRVYFSSRPFRHLLCSQLSGVGGSLTRAQPKTVEMYPIPLPPLKEQTTIVEFISEKLDSFNSAIRQVQQFLDGFDRYKEILIQAGVSGHLTANWREDNGVDRRSWTKTTLGKEFRWSSGGTPSRKQPEFYVGDIPWIKSGELPNGVVRFCEEHISKEAIEKSSTKLIPEGSVLIAMYGATIGKVGILPFPATTNQAIASAVVPEVHSNWYLFYFLQANRSKFIALGKGGAQPNISQTILKAYSVELPSLPEQQEIVRILDSKLEELEQARSLAFDALEGLQSLRSSIVSAALAGRLI
ncbi:restriction endonuclease subunit S [Staphylococcus chromogenes]|nr:restriction endonuclease subunit S [Staphylococcus chromogenes]